MQNSKPKTFLITGGGRGLGRATAEMLLKEHHEVIITCRTESACRTAIQEIKNSIPDAQVSAEVLDLCSFNSIRDFARRWNTKNKSIDVLFNNAGTMEQPKTRRVTPDGHEEVLQTNALGPLLLTELLLPSIKKNEHARVVFMSSSLHFPGSMGPSVNWNWSDPEQTQIFDAMVAYKNSKLAVNWTAFELAREWAKYGIDIISVCPGFFPETGAATQKGLMRFLMKYVLPYAPIAIRKKDAVQYLVGYLCDEKWRGKSGIFITFGKEKKASQQSQSIEEARRFYTWANGLFEQNT
jgi:NAD(P)-dependent dehydrogenase (short-subunit alcohol dehydrogenase family)